MFHWSTFVIKWVMTVGGGGGWYANMLVVVIPGNYRIFHLYFMGFGSIK